MTPKKSYDIVIIGGGPAGILAAGRASMLGAQVAVLEKMEKPARKLRITGKGRCNITNTKSFSDFIKEITPNPRFLNKAFGEFFNNDIVELLNNAGVKTITERGQRVFPESGKAWDVAEGLIKWAKNSGVEFYNHCSITEVIQKNKSIQGVLVNLKFNENPIKIDAKAVIIATGGKSYPATGSTGDGYNFAIQLGHRITDLRPSLVGIETHPCYPKINKLNLRNVNTILWVDNKKITEEFGEVEFTEYGLDGPCILRLSLLAIDAFRNQRNVSFQIDLKPALDIAKLDARLIRDSSKAGNYNIEMLLRDLLPQQLIPIFVSSLKLDIKKHASQLSSSDRKKIINLLKDFRFEMVGHRGWNEAIVTAGGVSLNEIDSKTMKSKLIEGLYFAGEVIDLSGNTGGYNLQIAFSTGWLAGESAAIYVKSL